MTPVDKTYLGDLIGKFMEEVNASPRDPYWIRVWEDSDRPLGLKEIMYGGTYVLVTQGRTSEFQG